MNKTNHTKSKSDTDFHSNKIINDDILGSLKNFQINLLKGLNSDKKIVKKDETKSTRKYSNLKRKNENSQFIFIIKKILIFKQQLDKFFFREKLPLIKFDLDNTLEIINKKIDILKNKLIEECPILYKSVLIDKLNELSVVIKSLIETKPQEFYKEIKFVILTEFEKIRLEIFELLENLHENEDNENNNLQDINKIKKECKFNHGILFNCMDEMDDEEHNDNILGLTSEIKENIISVILPLKNKILNFIEDITHDVLFSLTKFSYIIDYYSLSISNLNLQLFKSVISYVEKNGIYISKNKENISLFLIELIIILNRTFIKKSLIENKKKLTSESRIQNSMGKFILNNINELIPKCQGLNNNNNSLDKRLFKSLFIKTYEHFLLYKNYMKSDKNNKKIELVKSFKFYYDLKLIFWKSVYTKIDSNAKVLDICCRICEQNIPLNDFVLHVYYCKEQNHYYKKMSNFKSKIKKYINSLEIYKTKINQKFLNREHNFLKKNTELNKIFKKIKKEQELFYIDKNNTNDFLHTLIKIYINENNKPNDYYEKNPDKLYIISTLIYLTYFIYILNKKDSFNNKENEDIELSQILGSILSYLIQILLNTEYLLEARHTRTKSNRYLNNNMNFSFQSSSNDSFFSNSERYHSSKNVVFKDFNINNSQNISINLNLNEEKKNKRNSVRHQTFCMMMEDIKTKFSFNKALLNQSQTNISQYLIENMSNNESILSIKSSNSNLCKIEENKIKNTKTINDTKNFFETRSFSENKSNEIFNFFLNKNQSKKSSGYKKNTFLDTNKKTKNNIDSPSHRRHFLYRQAKSSKYLIVQKDLDFEKEPIKIDHKKNIFNFERKDSSNDGDNNMFENSISKEFFSQDKKYNNFESFSNSCNNSENEKDKNDNFFLGKNHFLSAKTNNNLLNIKNEKKIPSLFLKSDKMLLNYNNKPSLTFRDGLKKSLFQVQQNNDNKDNKNLDEKNNKNFIKSNSFGNLDNEDKNNKVPSENGDMENKDNLLSQQIEKVKIEDKKRGASHDFNKTTKNITIEKTKNLVLIDNYESSSESSSKSDDNNGDSNNLKNTSSENKNLNMILNLKNKSKDNPEYSNNSSDSDRENDSNHSNNVIIETSSANEKKLKDESQDKSFSRELSDFNQAADNFEEEQNWFNFDNKFFMNSDINAQNANVINSIKELLCEINNNNEDEKDDKDNDDDLANSKQNINLSNSLAKLSESSIKFSNFKLILPLAKGGYGTVGLYKKTSTGDMYAIKSVDINNMKEKKLSKTLQNERNILKGVSSDYVVNSYYIFKDNKNYYFVMEYLPGGDVYNLLSSIILPFSTIQLIIAETLLAIYYLHSINIIHHDIKPENILITKDGHFKLSDFGLSKTINEEKVKDDEEKDSPQNKSSSYSSSSSLSSNEHEHDDNKTEGTLFYMAPELFTSDFPVGKSIDYWAVGIVLFELFTFKVPFEAETQEQTRQNIIDYNINWEPMYSEEVSKNYKNYIDCTVDLIKKFIFFNPEQRWGDKNFKDIQNHEFFKGFDWVNIKKIKNSAVLSHLKKIVEKNNKKIKELNKVKGEKNNGNLICEVDLAYDESDVKFSQRIDNLQKRNNELIKMKFKKKEIKIEDDDKNFKHSLLFDLQ